MSPKKAAKKATKKAAKKHGKHHDHQEGKDVRRAYEHLGRVGALQGVLPASALPQIKTLSDLARAFLAVGEYKSSAELLRACEHLAFGALASPAKEPGLNEPLLGAIEAEYVHLIEKAAEHWDEHEEEPPAGITAIYEKAFETAETAFRKGAFRRAMEFARASHALAHVQGLGTLMLDGGRTATKRLKP